MNYQKNLDFRKNLKSVCLGLSIIKTITIPITLILAWLLSSVITQATSGEVKTVIEFSFVMMALILVNIAIQTTSQILIKRQQTKALNQCRMDFLQTFLEHPQDKLFQTNYGQLTENLNNDMDAFTKRYINSYPTILSSFLGVLGYSLFLIFQSPIIAVSLLVIALLQFIPPIIVKKYMKITYDQCRNLEAKITDHIVEGIQGFDVIKLYDLKQQWQKTMAHYHKEYLRVGRKTDAIAAAQRSMYRLLDNLLKFGTYALVGVYAMFGYCSFSVAVQAIYLSSSLFGYVKSISSTVPEIAVSKNAELRIRKWDSVSSSQVSFITDQSIANGDFIAIKDLSYNYKGKAILNHIHYQFNPNKNYVLLGNNGTGKTTLLNLIMKLLLPQQGYIVSNGPCVFIPQQDPIFTFDVNTLFHMFDSRYKSKFNSIAKQFGLTEQIMYGHAIRDLSGGERKKVFLTIGFALQSKWLLLDEPSNNLDQYGKEVLIQLIRERKGLIIISHDCSLISSADCKIKLENGGIYDESEK